MGSIVFIKDFNVWIMPDTDPPAAHPVTSDGSPDSPFTWVAQDDAGVIAAFAGPPGSAEEVLVRMDPQGEVVQPPMPMSGAGERSNLSLSPDGRFVAFTLVGQAQAVWPQAPFMVGGTAIMHADGQGEMLGPPGLTPKDPSWYSSSDLVMTTHNAFWTYRLGADDKQEWFQSCGFGADADYCASASEISPDLRHLAGVDGARLLLWSMEGPPPAKPTPACDWTFDSAQLSRPSWDPDGASLVFHVHRHENAVDGLYRMTGLRTRGCEDLVDGVELLVEDGYRPDWGPAPVSR